MACPMSAGENKRENFDMQQAMSCKEKDFYVTYQT